MKNQILNALFIFVITSGFLFAGEKQERTETNIPFQPGGYLHLKNENGDIHVTSWNEDMVHIIAFKRIHSSRKGNEDELLDQIEINIDQQGDELEIETRGPRSSDGFLGRIFNRNKSSYSVDYEIHVPEQIDLNLENANGNIEVRGVEGKIRLETTNGNIEAHEIEGLAKCKTTNGSIYSEFEAVPDEDKMSFVTTNGSIKLFLPEDFGGELDLKTINGNIDSDFPIRVEGRWSQKQFHGRVNEGNCDLHCSTVNGSIDLYYTD